MKIFPPRRWEKDERVVLMEPEPAIRITEGFRRLHHYAGRTLTKTALDRESDHRDRHLALAGMERSAGVVFGLEVGVEASPALDLEPAREGRAVVEIGDEVERRLPPVQGSWIVTISPGRGLCTSGEDVTVARPMRTAVDQIPTWGNDNEESPPPRGVGVLVLQPVVAHLPADPDDMDPCELDPREEAHVDYQRVDGCRLVWMPWPSAKISMPASGARFRNRLAYQIFFQEAASSHADPVFPWEEVGLPVALVQIAKNGAVVFVDRFAVVRRGGAPRARRPIFPATGTPFLWQARMDQFHQHLREILAEGRPVDDAAAEFRYLPPVGVLPLEVLDLEHRRVGFFPGNYRLEAAPVPLEQVEWIVEAAASLKPVDLFSADALMVYVPVAQELYDPRLLLTEEADPSLQETVDALLQDIGLWLSRRTDLRSQAPVVLGSVDLTTIPSYPDPDPDAQPGEKVLWSKVLRDVYKRKTLEALARLVDQTLSPYSLTAKERQALELLKAGDPDNPEYKDLNTFIAELDDKIRRSDDAVDLGFLKVQTDIYRMRQILLGDEKATRLATSPVLADIAKGETSRATELQLKSFFEKAGARETATALARAETPEATAGTAWTVSKKVEGLTAEPTTRKEATAAEIQFKNPIVGRVLDFRSTTVAERIADPLAPEAKNYAVATKAGILQSILEIPIETGDLKVPLSDGSTAVFARADFEQFTKDYREAASRLQEWKRIREQGRYVLVRLKGLTSEEQEALGPAFQVLLDHRECPMDDPGLPLLVTAGIFDPDPSVFDEAAYLASGVTALESAVGILRRIEARILDYRTVRDKCLECLAELKDIADQWAQALKAVDDELAERRHDLVVARSLLEEETARVEAVNRRRREILENHVPFVVYARPRRSSVTQDSAPRLSLHGLWKPAVPACLEKDHPAPEELEAMFAHLRALPLAWFPSLQNLLNHLDRPQRILDVFKAARDRALTLVSDIQQADTNEKETPPFGVVSLQKTVKALAESHSKAVRTRWEKKALLDLGALERLSWKGLKEEAQEILSVEDLLSGGLGRFTAARQASRQVQDMEDVAACLYARADRVPPAVRLEWARRISQFDAPVDLRSLSVLPRWSELSLELRKDLQGIADWLFAQVDPDIPEAVDFMNDLVRVALLLASHAPVGQIVSGHAPAPATGRTGDWLDLVIDKGLVRIGMQVAIEEAAGSTVHAVVEDMSGSEVRVKVTRTEKATFHIPAGAKATFLGS